MLDFLCAVNEINHFSTSVGDSSSFTNQGFAYLGAGICMFAALGAAIGQGIATAHACSGVARNPEAAKAIRLMLVIGAAITESASIYGLLIAFLLIFTTK